MRGLKLLIYRYDWYVGFAPITGAWIETSSMVSDCVSMFSHPSRVRGLKPRLGVHHETGILRTHHGCVDWNSHACVAVSSYTSHPSRVRGLKLSVNYDANIGDIRTHHGCVDWNDNYYIIITCLLVRTHHGCVDWNPCLVAWIDETISHPSRVRGLKHHTYLIVFID